MSDSPLIFDGSQLCSVQHTMYKVRELENVPRISAWQFGPFPFSKCAASTRSPIFFFFLFYFFFLFSFFSTSIGRQLVATATRRLLGFAFFILRLSAPLPARQRARSPAWQAAPAYGNARDKSHATRYSAGHPSITDVSSISFSCCLCALFVSAQRTRLAESLRLYDCRDKSGVAPPPDRTLPTDSFKYNSIGNNHDIPVPTMHRGRGGNLLVSCLYSVL